MSNLRRRYALLNAPQLQASHDIVLVCQGEVPLVADLPLGLVQAEKTALKEFSVLSQQHTDHEIFACLPGASPFLAQAVLTKFGDDRGRFPRPRSIQALAGT